jgi:hypothetical protein
MATAQLSTVDTWRGDIRHATLLHNEARKKAEPYAMWEREGRVVFVSEVQGMPMEQLRTLADDMRIAAASLNSAIGTENVLLAECPQDKPMMARDIRRKIGRLIARKEQCKYVMCEAIRCIKNLNREANKPKDKSKASNPKRRPRLMAGHGDDEHLSFHLAQKKLNHIKLTILFKSLRSSIGEEIIWKLETEASTAAMEPFTEWAKENGLRQEFLDHIIANELQYLAKKQG